MSATPLRQTTRWARVFVDEGRCIVYGASLGCFYLLDGTVALEPTLQRVLGLRSSTLQEAIVDPVERIAHDRASLCRHDSVPSEALQVAYRLLHHTRRLIPLRWMAWLLALLTVRDVTRRVSPSEIGQVLFAVERSVAFEDCYPRALLTLHLCLRAGHSCELLVGCLAPTRQMHAWCAASGVLPYEPSPEHFMYQPLYAMSFAP